MDMCVEAVVGGTVVCAVMLDLGRRPLLAARSRSESQDNPHRKQRADRPHVHSPQSSVPHRQRPMAQGPTDAPAS